MLVTLQETAVLVALVEELQTTQLVGCQVLEQQDKATVVALLFCQTTEVVVAVVLLPLVRLHRLTLVAQVAMVSALALLVQPSLAVAEVARAVTMRRVALAELAVVAQVARTQRQLLEL